MPVKVGVTTLVMSTSFLLINPAWSQEKDKVEQDWISITETSEYHWYAKQGSGQVADLDNAKNSAYTYVYQQKNKQKNSYSYGKVFIKLSACRNGYGYIYYNDMQGKFVNKNAFVRFGNTVADNIGSMACLSWDENTKKVSRQATDDAWELAATAKQSGANYYIKKDTARKRTYNGKPAVTALYGYEDVKAKTVSYSEYVITTADCGQGYGTIFELDFDGTLVDKNDIALSGNSVIAAVAQNLCSKR